MCRTLSIDPRTVGVWEFGSVCGVIAMTIVWYSEVAFAWVFVRDVIMRTLKHAREPFAILEVASNSGMQPCSRNGQLTNGSSRHVTCALLSEGECGSIGE